MPEEMNDHLSPTMMDVKDDSSDWQTSDEDRRGKPKTRSVEPPSPNRAARSMPPEQDWTEVGRLVMIGQEGPFTVEKRHADIPNSRWIYNLRDENGNIRTNVPEGRLKPHDDVPPHSESAASTADHAAPGPDGHSDNGGVGSSATTIVGN
ncbi:hypothetical protein SMMN14_04016 [Sphaerulina musiva]